MTSIDELDAGLIAELTENARVGVAELAARLGVSRNTVQQRMRRLDEEGIVTGFRLRVDLNAVGLHVQAFISLEIDQRHLARIIEALRDVPNVLEARTQAGRADLVLLVAAEDLESLQVLTAEIIDIPGVQRTETTLTVSNPIPYRLDPVLDRVTRGRGWGRSTPAAR